MRDNQQNYRRYDSKPNTQFQRYTRNNFQREACRKENNYEYAKEENVNIPNISFFM
jgi:hypothetical protein